MKNKQVFGVAVGVLWVSVLFFSYALALDSTPLKVNFLKGEYKAVIEEGERCLATATPQTANLDELYFLMALSYFKDGNYLRSSDIFEIILKEFPKSRFRAEAELGNADTYFMRGDLDKAEQAYRKLLAAQPNDGGMASALYYRLSQLAMQKGNTDEGKGLKDKLKLEFPLSLEARQEQNICLLADASTGFYTVQVGSFSKVENARKLLQQLLDKRYTASIQEISNSEGVTFYRVRVGKCATKPEALSLAEKLTRDGYPTKICP
jgi:tetratricopeptide (TPR) repeat protein